MISITLSGLILILFIVTGNRLVFNNVPYVDILLLAVIVNHAILCYQCKNRNSMDPQTNAFVYLSTFLNIAFTALAGCILGLAGLMTFIIYLYGSTIGLDDPNLLVEIVLELAETIILFTLSWHYIRGRNPTGGHLRV